jgi:hypothetical protein
MIILKLSEILLTFFSTIILISVLIFGGCGGGGGGGSTNGGGGGGAGSINLAWDAPTKNADGSDLTDLAGYYVYYGTASGVYGSPVEAKNYTTDVNNTVTYTLTGLTPGQTYFIAATAYDTSQNQSQLSNEVSGVAK